ncbi:MAG: hypothetical protein ACKO9Q_23620, partial [Pirellula sp.]
MTSRTTFRESESDTVSAGGTDDATLNVVFFQSTHSMQSCLDAHVYFHSQHRFALGFRSLEPCLPDIGTVQTEATNASAGGNVASLTPNPDRVIELRNTTSGLGRLQSSRRVSCGVLGD